MKNTIILDNLVFHGVHGYTAEEKTKPQRFKFSISLETNFHRAIADDDLGKTVDYRDIREQARKIIEEEGPINLLETIAKKIVTAILKNPTIDAVEVSVSKPDVWGNGVPTVIIGERQVPSINALIDFDWDAVLHELCAHGGVSFPMLPKERRLALVAEAENYPFVKQPEIAESPLVREQVSSCSDFLEGSPFHTLAEDFFEMLVRKMGQDGLTTLFSTPLAFNEMSMQLYEKDSIGITPHKDGKSRINLICVFVLKGVGRYALCDDRAGSNPRYLDVSPGNVILLRGPGFMGSAFQPFHFVTDITEERVVFGLRQRVPKNNLV